MIKKTKEQKRLSELQEMSIDTLKTMLTHVEERNIIKASSTIRKWISVFPVIERREKIDKIGFEGIANAISSILEDTTSHAHALAAAEGVFWSGVFQKIEAAEAKVKKETTKKTFDWKE
jgi:hypothetical protein